MFGDFGAHAGSGAIALEDFDEVLVRDAGFPRQLSLTDFAAGKLCPDFGSGEDMVHDISLIYGFGVVRFMRTVMRNLDEGNESMDEMSDDILLGMDSDIDICLKVSPVGH